MYDPLTVGSYAESIIYIYLWILKCHISSIFLPSLIVEYGCMVYIMHMILISDKAYMYMFDKA